jgi:hypothetical protein
VRQGCLLSDGEPLQKSSNRNSYCSSHLSCGTLLSKLSLSTHIFLSPTSTSTSIDLLYTTKQATSTYAASQRQSLMPQRNSLFVTSLLGVKGIKQQVREQERKFSSLLVSAHLQVSRPGKENNIDVSPTPHNCPEELLAVISLS